MFLSIWNVWGSKNQEKKMELQNEQFYNNI